VFPESHPAGSNLFPLRKSQSRLPALVLRCPPVLLLPSTPPSFDHAFPFFPFSRTCYVPPGVSLSSERIYSAAVFGRILQGLRALRLNGNMFSETRTRVTLFCILRMLLFFFFLSLLLILGSFPSPLPDRPCEFFFLTLEVLILLFFIG